MVHNMAPFIGACVKSLQWVDGIFIYDDHSTDNGLDIAQAHSSVLIKYEISNNNDVAFKIGEMGVRNYVIQKAFDELDVDAMIIADADELFSQSLKNVIYEALGDASFNSIAFSIWHLYDRSHYIHFWETDINGVYLIDPHTRVIMRGKWYTKLFEDGSHPILEADSQTFCVHGPYHFHLKYFYKSTLPNYSLYFLPKILTQADVLPYLRLLPFSLSDDIREALNLVDWNSLPEYKETPHYSSKRIRLTDPRQALIHPKDLNKNN